MKFLQNSILTQTLLKRVKFQVKHFQYIKENSNYVFRDHRRDFRGALVRSKGIVPSSFKVTTRNHSQIIRFDGSEVDATRLTTADDLNLQGWSWSHKLESLCC